MNKREIKRELRDYEEACGTPFNDYTKGLMEGYHIAGLLINKLDKLEEIVVPHFVYEHIKKHKKNRVSISYALSSVSHPVEYDNNDKKVREYFYDRGDEESFKNQEIYAKAWMAYPDIKLEEKLYRVIFPTDERLVGFGSNGKKYTVISRASLVQIGVDSKDIFTEKEIKSLDERYLKFMEEVKDIEKL